MQETLYKEYLGRTKQTDLSVPYKNQGYWYYTRTQEGKQYPIFFRKKGSLDSAEEILLDGNELAKGEKFFSVAGLEVSDDGNMLAFATDTTGYREYYLTIKDLKTGEITQSRFVKASRAEWAADNATLFYVTEDAAKRVSSSGGTCSVSRRRRTHSSRRKRRTLPARPRQVARRKYLFRTSRSATTAEQWHLPPISPRPVDADRAGKMGTIILPTIATASSLSAPTDIARRTSRS